MESLKETSAICLKKFADSIKKIKENKKKGCMIKDNYSQTPIDNINLIHILISRHYDDEEVYSKNDEIYNYIRRGNCLIKEKKDLCIGRIGLPKFFDYSKKNNDICEKFVLSRVRNIKGKIQMFYEEKANGENFQVSYNKKYQAWIVASKNVSLFLRNEQDLEFYENENKKNNNGGFFFALDFAKLWFEYLKTNLKDKINDFKEELGDYTLVGESVGDVNHQHIKLYTKRDILFYAIIKNEPYTEELCLPPSKAFEILKKYGLSHVAFTPSKIFDSYEEMKNDIDKKYDELLVSTIETGGEGNVVYFVEVNGNEEKVLALAKLKTFEYRFYRKVREKCKQLRGKNKKPIEVLFRKLEKESNELIENCKDKLATPFEDYLKYGYNVLKYQEMQNKWDFSDKFASFFLEIQNSVKNGVKIEDLNYDEINNKFGRLLKD